MNNLVSLPTASRFVKPHFIQELGCEGLTTQEIAFSLGMRADTVRRDLKEGKAERILNQGFLLKSQNRENENKVEFTDYILDVNAAKFFVAKHNSEIGDSYLAFLIGCERVVEKIQSGNMQTQMLQAMLDMSIRQDTQEVRLDRIEDTTSEAPLTLQQRNTLLYTIHTKAKSLHDVTVSGKIMKKLKIMFNIPAMAGKFYDIPQRDYETALAYVKNYR